MFIETSFFLRSPFQFRLFPPVSSRGKDGLTLEAELQELEEPDLQNTARRLKAQVAHTPGLVVTAIFVSFWDDIKRNPSPIKKQVSCFSCGASSKSLDVALG